MSFDSAYFAYFQFWSLLYDLLNNSFTNLIFLEEGMKSCSFDCSHTLFICSSHIDTYISRICLNRELSEDECVFVIK